MTTESVDICPLHHLDSSLFKFQLECSYKEDLPSSIGNIEKLNSEGFFCASTDLESFFGGICGLPHLTKLELEGNISELPKDLDRLQCLEELALRCTKIKHLPDSICMLKHLKSLKLYHCELLEKLPEDLDRLECLETLKLEQCVVLRDIPNNICWMKSLRCFSLWGCNRVEELPEELGRLECLQVLDITGTCINNLPQSILLLEEQGLRVYRSENESPATATTVGCCCTVLKGKFGGRLKETNSREEIILKTGCRLIEMKKELKMRTKMGQSLWNMEYGTLNL